MASETFYFFFSVIAFFGALAFIASSLFFRITGKTIFGEKIKPTAPAYKNMKELTSNCRLTISVILALVFAANLVYDIVRVIKMNDPEYMIFLFIVAPVTIIVIFGLVFRDVYRRFGNKKSK